MNIELMTYLIEKSDVIDFICSMSVLVLIMSVIAYLICKGINISNFYENAEIVQDAEKHLYKLSEYIIRKNDCVNNTTNYFINLSKKAIKISLILTFIGIITPSQKTMYLMAGEYFAAQSGIPQKVLTIINDKLQEYIDKAQQEIKSKST